MLRRIRLEAFSTRRRIPLLVTVDVDQGVAHQLVNVVDGVFVRRNNHRITSPPIDCRCTTWSRMKQRVLGTAIAVKRSTLIEIEGSTVLTVCIKEIRCSTATVVGIRLILRGEQKR